MSDNHGPFNQAHRFTLCQRDIPVRNNDDVQALVRSVVDKWGRVDVLVNNAGITSEALMLRTSEEVFTDVMNTNLKGPFNMVKAVLKHMMEQRKGHIINISSYAGIKGKQGLSAYYPQRSSRILS